MSKSKRRLQLDTRYRTESIQQQVSKEISAQLHGGTVSFTTKPLHCLVLAVAESRNWDCGEKAITAKSSQPIGGYNQGCDTP
jgi:hypothetical protein